MAIDKRGHSLGKQRSTVSKASKDGGAGPAKASAKPQKSWRLRVQEAPEPLVLPKKKKEAVEGQEKTATVVEKKEAAAAVGGGKKRKADAPAAAAEGKEDEAAAGDVARKVKAKASPKSKAATAAPSSSSSKPATRPRSSTTTSAPTSSSKKKVTTAAAAPAPTPEALLAGLDPAAYSSDGDDSSDDEDEEDVEVDSGPVEGIELTKLPTVDKSDKAVQARLAKAKKAAGGEKGVLYLGRIPHGFYEAQMKAYFGQFGDVEKVRLARNKKTGKSKHYAFLLMSSLSVAKIVAETMDNYLLLGHILRCKVIPNDEVHADLWVGANRKWRAVPSVRLERAKLEQPRTAAQQARAESRLLARQAAKQAKLAAAGIEYDLAPVGFKKAA